MKLTFVRPHASITSLPHHGIDLGKLTVITGRNGSGKSQLLEAIESGHVKTDVASKERIYRRDWQTFVPADVEATPNRKARLGRLKQYEQLQATRNNYAQLLEAAGQSGLDRTRLTTRADILALSVADVAARLPSPTAAETVWTNLRNADDADNANLRGRADMYGLLSPLADALGKAVLDLTADDVDQDVLTTWGMSPFQATFVQPFVDYRNLHINNALAALSGLTHLDEEAFVAKYGEKPWIVLNEALTSVGLPFAINAPKLNDPHEEYVPRLTKRGSGVELPFSRLSSGEKILMSLAITVYYGADKRLTPKYPKLILLDEVDAPLHPSMARDFLRIVQGTLIEQQDLHVILTTHSPSTVALAPEDSIVIMTDGGDRLRKASKAEALNLLTEAVPTLAINAAGRRQVFVESPIDVEVCSDLYSLLRPNLPVPDRSLDFVATGTADPTKGSHINTGVDNTLRVVELLVQSGNGSVFALVDADGSRKPDPAKRIHVYAQGKRNGLENCIYDPLIVLLLVARHGQSHFTSMDISDKTTDTELASMTTTELQVLVDKVQTYLLGPMPTGAAAEAVRYQGGLTLNIRSDYLSYDDHALVELIEARLGALKSLGNSTARMRKIVNNAFRAYPQFIPVDLVETFESLLRADAHIEGAEKEG